MLRLYAVDQSVFSLSLSLNELAEDGGGTLDELPLTSVDSGRVRCREAAATGVKMPAALTGEVQRGDWTADAGAVVSPDTDPPPAPAPAPVSDCELREF